MFSQYTYHAIEGEMEPVMFHTKTQRVAADWGDYKNNQLRLNEECNKHTIRTLTFLHRVAISIFHDGVGTLIDM